MSGDRPQTAEEQVLWWEPGRVVTTMWVTLAILLGTLTLLLLGMVYSLVGASASGSTLQFNWIAITVLTVVVLGAHQVTHAVVARWFGATPRFDFDVIQWIIPVMYCRPGDYFFERNQFIFYALAPLGILTVIGIVLMPLEMRSAWLIVPLSLNACLSTRDIWTAWIVWRLPSGSLIQIERDGLRLILSS
jgi:hypothetical protein